MRSACRYSFTHPTCVPPPPFGLVDSNNLSKSPCSYVSCPATSVSQYNSSTVWGLTSLHTPTTSERNMFISFCPIDAEVSMAIATLPILSPIIEGIYTSCPMNLLCGRFQLDTSLLLHTVLI